MHAPREHRGFEIGRKTGGVGGPPPLDRLVELKHTIDLDAGDIYAYSVSRLGAFPQASYCPLIHQDVIDFPLSTRFPAFHALMPLTSEGTGAI